MDKQLVFDKVKEHLMNQKERCVIQVQCLYRHNDNKCAIGCLIPDDKYHPDMDTQSSTGISHNNLVQSVLSEIYGELDLVFLSRLQAIHDINWNIKEERLGELAKEYELKE